MNNDEGVTKLGVGLVILKGTKLLMSKRRNAHGSGSFAGPGGSLQYMESPKDAVLRELKEECGNSLKISDPKLLCVVHWEEFKPIHYIGFGFIANYIDGEAEITEPEKFESWEWYELNDLPHPLFGVMQSYIEWHLYPNLKVASNPPVIY
jgi:8-oxo-dGTP diphosphatase